MGMQRPVWTICFFFIWILLLPGILLTHLALIKLIPEVEDLPGKVIKGFDEVFKFAYLAADSIEVQNAANDVVTACGKTPTTFCPTAQQTCTSGQQALVTCSGDAPSATIQATKARIVAAFAKSLAVVERVASDQYFGQPGLEDTATQLDDITKEVENIPDGDQPCVAALPMFCEISNSADSIVAGMSMVTAEIDKFKDSDIVKQWDENKTYLTLLHCMPYFMVIAMLFFTLFWYRGGVCCCCRDGTKAGCGLILMAIFWLASFILYVVVLASGIALSVLQKDIEVPVLKGNPSLEQAIDHIQYQYPEFWRIVFADLVDGLDQLYKASWFFNVVALIILIYGFCECCCCPYRKKADPKPKQEEPPAPPPPKEEPQNELPSHTEI
jgi:hypothetical protein